MLFKNVFSNANKFLGPTLKYKRSTALNINYKSFAKKTSNKKKKETEELYPEHKSKEDRMLEEFVKYEEENQRKKEMVKEKQKEKRQAGLQCLVLHPVFNDK